MARLIDANALKRAFCNHCDGEQPCTEPCVDIVLIETAPTIDAVPVTRCGKCKHYKESVQFGAKPETVIIGCPYHPNDPNWYCADGERKDGEHEERNTIR